MLLRNCVNVMSGNCVSNSESSNSVSGSQKSDVEVTRPKTVERADGETSCSPGNGSVMVD